MSVFEVGASEPTPVRKSRKPETTNWESLRRFRGSGPADPAAGAAGLRDWPESSGGSFRGGVDDAQIDLTTVCHPCEQRSNIIRRGKR